MMIGVGDKGAYIICYEASSRLSHDETLFFLCFFFPVSLLSHVCSVLSLSGRRRKRLIECPGYWIVVTIREWDH